MNKELKALAEKVLIRPETASEELGLSDENRIRDALSTLGYENFEIPLKTLRMLYPLSREGEGEYTVTLVHKDDSLVMTKIEPGDTRGHLYGIALDYGSTTIVMQLVNLNDGKVIYQHREINDQREYGKDILTRIVHGLAGTEARRQLHLAVVNSIQRGLKILTQETGIELTDCPIMVMAGNTTMIHFLLELDAWTVFSSPYCPVTTAPGYFFANELEIDFPGLVYIFPSASNYIGGDIVSGLITLDMLDTDKIQILFDVGTNGEMVVGCKDWIVAGAGAAGPALEGDISRFGMVAGAGAISHMKITKDQVWYETIEDAAPVGICGSGIVDLVAEMRLNGWIDIAGKLRPEAGNHIVLKENEEGDREYAAVYVWAKDSGLGEDLYFSQTDIDQYTNAKAAAHTMLECLLETAGIAEDDIDIMNMSGAMCEHSDLESAITIGMFPDLPRNKFVNLHNSSLDGARTLLLNRDKLKEIQRILNMIYCVQLASVPDFTVRMMAAKFLPHTDQYRYPTVFAHLKELGMD